MERPTLLLWGLVLCSLVVVAFGLALHAALQYHHNPLEVRLRALHGPSGSVVVGDGLSGHWTCENPSETTVRIREIHWETTSGWSLQSWRTPMSLAAHRQGTATVHGVAEHTGPAFVHGAHVLLTDPLGLTTWAHYHPMTEQAMILPRSVALVRQSRTRHRTHLRRQGRWPAALNQRGMSTDFKELRDHVPGDPYRNIAWKASARRGKWVVKEHEELASGSTVVLIDIGPAMRSGLPGRRALDTAIDNAFQLAHRATVHREEVALVSFDESIYRVTQPCSGAAAERTVMSHLLELYPVVDEAFTDIHMAELIPRIGDYIQTHDGVDFHTPLFRSQSGIPDAPGWDEQRMAKHARESLERGWRQGRPMNGPAWPDSARLDSQSVEQILRSYCRYRGIELPYRSHWSATNENRGLSAAMEEVLSWGAGPHTIWILHSFGDRAPDHEQWRGLAALARQRHHRLVLQPLRQETLPSESPDTAWLLDLVNQQQAPGRGELFNTLRKQGVTVLPPAGHRDRAA